MTNITFIFETFSNTKPKEKKVRRHGIYYVLPSEKVGVTRPPPNYAHAYLGSANSCYLN